MDRVNVEALSSLPLLHGADPSVLQSLARSITRRVVQPGAIILEEGAGGGEMYLITEGSVEIVTGHGDDEMVLATRGPGELIGEMAFLEEQPRFATVRSLAGTTLLEIPARSLSSALFSQPSLLYRVMQSLSTKLRESDLHMVHSLQQKNVALAQAYHDLKDAQAALVEKERQDRELELARDLQQSIVPQVLPTLPGLSFAGRYRPARLVGGDFYDVFPVGDRHTGLVMADVSDKGIAAALYMALAHSLIRAEAQRSHSPAQVLHSVHQLLLQIAPTDMFVTVFYALYDQDSATLRYVRAGHDRPLLSAAGTGSCRFLQGKGMLLGLIEEVDLEEVEITLRPGDCLVSYSDGISDATNADDERFGLDRLQDAVCRVAAMSAHDACETIFESATAFQGDSPQFDDMALLVMKVACQNRVPQVGVG